MLARCNFCPANATIPRALRGFYTILFSRPKSTTGMCVRSFLDREGQCELEINWKLCYAGDLSTAASVAQSETVLGHTRVSFVLFRPSTAFLCA